MAEGGVRGKEGEEKENERVMEEGKVSEERD